MSSDVLVAPEVADLRARYSPVALVSAAVLTLGAGAVHLAVVPDHLQEYLPFGVFFVVVGLGQMATGVAVVVRPSRTLFTMIATAAAVLGWLWLVSRTSGLPVGPDPWTPEPVGTADVVCTAFELFSLPVLLTLGHRGQPPRRHRPVRTPLANVPVVLLAAVATFVGVGAGLSGMPVAFSAAPAAADPGATPVIALVAAPGAQPLRSFTLTAQPATIGGRPSFTYDGTVPGPELRVTQGDRVRVTLVNELPVSTTLHWHGLRVPNAVDGVAGLTQDAVAPDQSFTYEFVASDAGTFWYHSHQDTENQIAAGLFGALVVEPPGGHVAETLDQTVLLHNAPDGSGATAVNGGTGDLRLAARPGQTVRLRIIDAVVPDWDGAAQSPAILGALYRVAALDGHDLSDGQQLGPQRLPLGMGQRADVVFTMPPSGAVQLVNSAIAGAPSAPPGASGLPPRPSTTLTLGSGAPPPAVDPATLPVFDPLRYGVATPDPADGPAAVTTTVVLDARYGFHDGAVEWVHSINGAAAPEVPPIVVHPGQLVRLHMVNNTGEFHPMHLHGHVVTLLDVDGRPSQGSPVHLDTVLVWPHQSADVAFLADNPGIWMLHCHVLLHASMGMSMTINYTGVSTPFTMGSRSGNMPE
jgi:FtsP/CotA-like multicopper oxidase with cupredoxin domain